MNNIPHHKQSFPLRFTLQGKRLVLRPLNTECRDAMLQFARKLPEDDLLFLDRDITQQDVLDKWIDAVEQEQLFTIVGWYPGLRPWYPTVDQGIPNWTRHVVELRVVVADEVRGIGVGGLLLELVFERALEMGATKLVARMTPDQTRAKGLFERLGFEEEAVLQDHAMDGNGLTHNLLVYCFHTRKNQENCCSSCGIPVLAPLSLDGARFCSHCYELRYDELGSGD